MYIPFTTPIVFLCHFPQHDIKHLPMLRSSSKIHPEPDEVSLLRNFYSGDRSPVVQCEVVYYSGHAGEIHNGSQGVKMNVKMNPSTTRTLPSMWQSIKNAFTMPQ